MERREKTEFLLEQMRLLVLVAKGKDAATDSSNKDALGSGGETDWIKVRVGGRKVNAGFLQEKGNEVSFLPRVIVVPFTTDCQRISN